MTVDALNLAEKWRLPVILMLDQALCQNTTTSAKFDLGAVKVERGARVTAADTASMTEYKAYKITENGISPYAPPGTPGLWAEITGNEHDEWGHVSVNSANRVRMMRKRMEKMVKAQPELPPARLFGDPNAKIGLIGYGSTSGPIRETQTILATRGIPTRYFQARTVYPVPVPELDPFLKDVDVAYVVEHNYTGQFARLVREHLPWHHAKLRSILKFDGASFRTPEIIAAMPEVR